MIGTYLEGFGLLREKPNFTSNFGFLVKFGIASPLIAVSFSANKVKNMIVA
jgi:hypothetical protein